MKRRYWFLAIVLLLALALYIPRISAGRYRDSVRTALEKGLGRKVDLSDVRFRLLPTPGIIVTNVVIGEDPKIGAEPFVYVNELIAVPRITSLFGGPLAFASIDLGDASMNLNRIDRPETGVTWNFASLLRPATLAAFPSVHLSGGRINFKFGDTKSLVYLLHTDVDLWPPDSAQGPWTLRVHAEPARTDKPAGGFGTFVARGQWLSKNNTTTLDVKLEKSELGDILTLFNGSESGIHGDISGDAHMAGPLNRIGIAGRMAVSNVHGWNQTPPGGNAWRFAIGGAVDLPGQTIDLDARATGAPAPLEVRYRVADYLRRPRWGVTVNVNHFPLAPVPDIARNLGFPVPPDFKLDGAANGAVGYSLPGGAPRMDGAMNLSSVTFTVAGAPPLHMPDAALHFSGSTVTLGATAIATENKRLWPSPDRGMPPPTSSMCSSPATECRSPRCESRFLSPAFLCWAMQLQARGKARSDTRAIPPEPIPAGAAASICRTPIFPSKLSPSRSISFPPMPPSTAPASLLRRSTSQSAASRRRVNIVTKPARHVLTNSASPLLKPVPQLWKSC